MGAAIELRADFDGATLRCLARKTKTAKQSRRLPALAGICDGGRRGDAARIGGVGLQIVRDRVLRFNARGPDGLIDGKAPGPQPKLDDTQRQALAAIVEGAPTPEVHGVVRWRLSDLAQWLHAEFVAPCGICGLASRNDREPETRKARPCQAHGAAPPPCAGHRSAGGVQKTASQPSWKRCAQPSREALQ